MLLMMVTTSCVSTCGLTFYGRNKEVITWLLSQVLIYQELTWHASGRLRITTTTKFYVFVMPMFVFIDGFGLKADPEKPGQVPSPL